MCKGESVIQVIVCNILNSKCVKFFFQNCTQQTDVRCKYIFPERFSPVSSCIQPVHSHHFCIQPVHSHHFCDSDSTYMLLFNSVFWREFKLPIHITFVIVILHFCLKNIFSRMFCDSDSTYMLLFNSVFWREFKLLFHITFVIVIFTWFLSCVAFFCLTVYLLYNVQCGKCNTSDNINICFLFNFPTKISCNDITKIMRTGKLHIGFNGTQPRCNACQFIPS